LRFWFYFVGWFLAHKTVLICFADKCRSSVTKSIASFMEDKAEELDKSA